MEPEIKKKKKKYHVQEQWKKKLMMWKVMELETKVWKKIGSDVSRKVTPSLGRHSVAEAQSLVHC